MKRTFIIAEVGVNHNGSLEQALQLIDAAADAGVDAVKFQTFCAEKLVTPQAFKANYQIANTGNSETQLEMLKKLEISKENHAILVERCKLRGVQFLSSPFNIESVDLLNNLNVQQFKIASGEINNAPLILKVAKTGKPVILSTGMSNLGEIEMALGVLAYGYTSCDSPISTTAFQEAYYSSNGQNAMREKVTLLHCTTEYPAEFSEINLRSMDTLHSAFDLNVGYSDHTPGIAIAIAAVARGAIVIEKHFTLDCGLPGPDHKASVEPAELKLLVRSIRQVENSLGNPRKIPQTCELKNKLVARKSLVAARSIRKGEPFTAENLAIKRPGTGISPIFYWDWLDKIANKDYEQDEVLRP